MATFKVGDLIELADYKDNVTCAGMGSLPSFGEVVECVKIYTECGEEFVRFRYLDSGLISTDWWAKRFKLVENPIDVIALLNLI